MSRLPTSTVREAHAYTRDETPWILDGDPGKGVCARLVHYLSGGGMRTFGRTLAQERARHRHKRFFVWAGAFGLCWLYFYIF